MATDYFGNDTEELRTKIERQNKEALDKNEKRIALLNFLNTHPEFEEYLKLKAEAGY